MKILKFFKKIQWFFSFNKRKKYKEWTKKSNKVFEQTVLQNSDEIFTKCNLNFNAPMEEIEIKSNNFFVQVGDVV